MSATLVLVRHGEIIRPPYTSNFDRAPLSRRGEEQIRILAGTWPADRPSAIFTSPLRRSIESAIILADVFGLSMSKRPCLKEWSADDSGISSPQSRQRFHRVVFCGFILQSPKQCVYDRFRVVAGSPELIADSTR